MGANNMQVADATIATLIERLDNVIAQQSKLEGMLLNQAQQLGAIPVMQAQMIEFNEKFNRAFTAIRQTGEHVAGIDRTVGIHGWTWKITGAVLIMCCGLIGWGWNQLESSKARDSAMDRRTLLIEYKLGIAPASEGEK